MCKRSRRLVFVLKRLSFFQQKSVRILCDEKTLQSIAKALAGDPWPDILFFNVTQSGRFAESGESGDDANLQVAATSTCLMIMT